jgi:trehalose 6-phosphate synthase
MAADLSIGKWEAGRRTPGARRMPRLILVSNRVAVPDSKGPRQAGGLAVAVDAALKRREGLWFGWSGKVTESDGPPEPAIIRRRRRTFITIDLTQADFQEYWCRNISK